MVNPIVTVNVSQVVAPAPSTLQGTGAFISQGGTNTASGTRTLLTSLSDLTALTPTPKALTSLAWSAMVVTGTTTSPHGWTNGESIYVTIAGAVPTGYNGTFLGTITGTSTFTYPLTANPGSETTPGTVTLGQVAELKAMATTFFAQGSATSVYVLELGEGNPADGVTALETYITANPAVFYSYLVPKSWAAEATLPAFLANYESDTAKTYFFISATSSTYTNFTALEKCAFVLVQAPATPSTEFSCAAPFYVTLSYAPSTSNKVTPTAFSYLFGVTAYPTAGNGATLTAVISAGANYVGSGAEGGISNTILRNGTTMDGHDFTYWYSVDWVQINVDIDISNAIINGSNNPVNPLYYDQNGINRLQAAAQGTMNRGIGDGLVLAPASVAAIPFSTYVAANPNDYPIGAYNGLSVTYTPNRGFKTITFNVVVSNFPLS